MATTSDVLPRSPNAGLNRILLLLALSVFLNYIDRSNLSVAAPLLKDELHISASQLGVLLSAFFWTYAACQLASGWLVDRFDVKWVFVAGFFLWSVATAVTGLLHSFAALLAVRVMLGMGESVAYPSYSKIIAGHFPENRRGFANSMVSAGLYLGPAVGLLLGGPLIAQLGWRPFFLLLGFGSLLWLVPWLAWMPDRGAVPSGSHQQLSFFTILRQRSAIGTCLGLFCGNYCLYFLVTWLPFYLVRERHFSLREMSLIGGAVFLTGAASAALTGKLSDLCIVAGASPTRARKTVLALACLCFAMAVAAAVYSPRTLCIACLLVAAAAIGGGSSNIWAVTQRLAGVRAVGRWCGLQLFFANLSGIVAPALTGFLVDRSGNFHSAFLVMAAVSALGALVWVYVIGPIEPVAWPSNS
ncbi:MAG TPA: MFS transporter [Candidatus Acidoferrum sp.]|nr:MFS transporter [Candidatus Acidoferrum sp.]